MVPASQREALSPKRVSLCAQGRVGCAWRWVWARPRALTWGHRNVRCGWRGVAGGTRRERKEKERKSKGPYL